MENQKNNKIAEASNLYGEEVLTELLPDLQALDADDLVAIGVDVRSVTATVLGALTEIRKHSEAIAKAEPKLDAAALDKLERAAYALNLAHANYLAAGQPSNDLLAMVEEGMKLRERLMLDAKTLAARGLLDGSRLEHLELGVGYKNLSADLLILAKVLRDGWPTIQGKCATERAELDRAGELGQKVIKVVGLREAGPAATTSASDIRARAFTLVVQMYDEFRRVITFLRWKGEEAERIAPSLYANRASRRRSDVAQPEPQAPPPQVIPAPGRPNGAAAAPAADNNEEEHGPFMA